MKKIWGNMWLTEGENRIILENKDKNTVRLAAGKASEKHKGHWIVGRIYSPYGIYWKEKSMRIGSGYDVHKLAEGRDCIIGGVTIL